MARYAKFFSLGGGGGTNNLQLPVGTILDATLRQVQDGTGTGSPLYLSTGGLRVGTTAASAMYWDNVNNRLGIGTTTPLAILHLKSTAAITRMIIDGDAGFNKLISYRTGALQRFGLYVNNTAESGSNAGSNFAIRAYNDAGTLLSTPFFINRATGNVGVNTLTGTAKLQVFGSGSTSATTSFLVQNSLGNERFRVYDDGTVFIGNATPGIYTTFGDSGRIGNNIFNPPAVISRYGSGQLGFLGTNNNAAAFAFGFNNEQASTSTGISMINLGGEYKTQQSFQFSNLQIESTYNFNANTTSAAIARGIYYNPTITNLRVAKHYAWQNTSGAMIVNSATPQASAVLQADSTTQGFLPPRMTTAQKNAIASPANGLIVYDTDLVRPCFFNGATWITL
jgi:hypothetical protein